jgi:DNA-binding HxlR family transcriptional regulator
MADHDLRSDCAIAATLDIVGDRWSLLVVRDFLFRDELRYGDPGRLGRSTAAGRRGTATG